MKYTPKNTNTKPQMYFCGQVVCSEKVAVGSNQDHKQINHRRTDYEVDGLHELLGHIPGGWRCAMALRRRRGTFHGRIRSTGGHLPLQRPQGT